MKRWFCWMALGAVVWAQGLPLVEPGKVGMDRARLAEIEGVVREAISHKQLPGAVVVVGHKGRLVYRRAFGNQAVEPQPEAMTADTVFDLASLTKPVATASSVMILVEHGKIRLNDPLSRYLPEIQDEAARKVTVEQLYTHTSGYASGLDRTRPWQGRRGALQELVREPLRRPAGSHFEYSDINYIALGLIVEKASGQSLAEFAQQHVFQPLRMSHTCYLPQGPVAPTQRRGGKILRGSVHDHVAAKMGGIAGHAGLFSRGDDLARYCQMMLNGGTLDGRRVLSRSSVARMIRPVVVSESGWTRGLGWDIDTAYSSNRGELFPKGSYGHTGFTGTSLWIDPSSQTFVVFLSNRVHPDGSGDVIALRSRVATLAASALVDMDPEAWRRAEQGYASQVSAGLEAFRGLHPGPPESERPATFRVLNGVDILQETGYRELAGKRLGLITNQTGRNRAGELTLDLLHKAPNLQLKRVFSPEHGLRGLLDEAVADSLDEATGLPVISLYGQRKRPLPQDLEGLDTVVFDIQDAGTRFYTYSATLRYMMEAAAAAHLPLYLLDRPNPLGGAVEGPVSDENFSQEENSSFTCPHSLPVRHGLTMGELARLYQGERHIEVDLHVIAMDPWRHALWFDQVQQDWVNPSPNLRNLTATLLYPGVGLIEAGNVSVGRGTDRPFEQIGAPWMDGQRLATLLNAQQLPGLRFVSTHFRPTGSKFQGKDCDGVQILVVDRAQVRPLRLGLELISGLRRLHPQQFPLEPVGRLMRHADTMKRLEAGQSPSQIEESWRAGVQAFQERCKPYLLYP